MIGTDDRYHWRVPCAGLVHSLFRIQNVNLLYTSISMCSNSWPAQTQQKIQELERRRERCLNDLEVELSQRIQELEAEKESLQRESQAKICNLESHEKEILAKYRDVEGRLRQTEGKLLEMEQSSSDAITRTTSSAAEVRGRWSRSRPRM